MKRHVLIAIRMQNDEKIDNKNDTNEVTLNDVLMIIIIQDVLNK